MTTVIDAVTPHSIEAEKSTLGAVLIANEEFERAELEAGDFFRVEHRLFWGAFEQLRAEGSAIDMVTVRQQLGADRLEAAGGSAYLASLVDGVPRASNVDAYASIVREMSIRRQIMAAAHRARSRGADLDVPLAEVLADLENALYGLRVRRRSEFVALADILREETGPRIDSLLSGLPALGLPTGFADVDAQTRGLHPGQLTLLAARPGIGKSALAMQIAAHVASRHSGAVAVASLEMSREELSLRMVIVNGQVNAERLYNGRLRMDERERVIDALKTLQALPFHVDDGMDLSIPVLRAKLRRLAQQYGGLALLVIDYLQLMQTPSKAESRALAVGDISRGLKGLSKELHVPALALSQLNRDVDKRTGGRPRLSDLRESGSLEQDADNVWLLHREEEAGERTDENAGIAELIIAKQRNGPTGTVKLKWDRAMTRFDNLEWRR